MPNDSLTSLAGFAWRNAEVPPAETGALAGALDLPRPVASLLAARELGDPDAIRRFLNPTRQKLTDPLAVAPFRTAAERLIEAATGGGEIVVFGDFDADGVVATALLADMIRCFGGRARPFLPNRHGEGYGLTEAALARCLAGGVPALFVTVDCGMGATAQLAGLQARGIRLLVTDHHTLAGGFPVDCVVVNPHLPGIPEPMRSLCGAGVAFQVASAAVKLRGDRPDERLRLAGWLDAVAVATVADVVPLLGDNRILVACGLRALNRKPRTGLGELMRRNGLSNRDLDSGHLGFVLGPRLNAAGRMDTAEPALRLLLAEDPDEVRALAFALDQANLRRKTAEQELLSRADEHLAGWFDPARHGAVVAGGERWHPGVVGLVAARLSARCHRPAAVVALDAAGGGHGSVRAGDRYNAVEALRACGPWLARMGGHARAAGFALKPGTFGAFREAFAAACFEQVGAAFRLPELWIDGWLSDGDIDIELIRSIRRLEPFGEGHPRPCWALRGVTLQGPPQAMGADGDHLRLKLLTAGGLPLQAVWFRAGRHLPRLAAHAGPFEIAGELQENTYRDEQELQLVVRDVRLPAP